MYLLTLVDSMAGTLVCLRFRAKPGILQPSAERPPSPEQHPHWQPLPAVRILLKGSFKGLYKVYYTCSAFRSLEFEGLSVHYGSLEGSAARFGFRALFRV